MSKWDEYFLKICEAVASNSSCKSRQIGAILVQDKSIVSTGYNGPPRGVPECWKRLETPKDTCPRRYCGFKTGEALDLCVATHAEVNCLLNAARLGVPTKGTKMYMTCGVPCKNCLSAIINAGVFELIVTSMDFYDAQSRWLIRETGLDIRLFDLGGKNE